MTGMQDHLKNWNKIFIFFLFSFCLYYMENGYFNTIIAKSYAYRIALMLYLIPALILCTSLLLTNRKITKKGNHQEDTRRDHSRDYRRDHRRTFLSSMDLTDGAVAFFTISSILSTLLSPSPFESFFGNVGWQVGLWSLLGGAAIYALFRMAPVEAPFLIQVMGIFTLPLFLWAIANGFGADPFSLHKKLLSGQRYDYIACIGNINAFSGYLSLILPPMYAGLVFCEKDRLRLLLAPSAFLGTMALFYNNSDGGYLGVLSGLAAVTGYALFLRQYKRILSLLWLIALAGSLSLILSRILPFSIPLRGISARLSEQYIPIVALGCCSLLLLLLLRFCKKESQRLPFFLYTGALAMAFLYAVIWFFRHFSPAFGNNRGYIWGYAVGIFRRLPALQKIFGVGPDRFGVYTSRYYGARMQKIWGNTVSNAHCEYLQYLVTTGILGAMGYIAMLSAALKNSFYKKKTDPKVSLFIYGIIGYFAQALVNNPHNLLIPVFFLFLATAENEGSASSSLQI